MSPDGDQPSPGPWPVGLAAVAKPNALPDPVPLHPTPVLLPQVSTVHYCHLYTTTMDEEFIVAARAPVGSILKFLSLRVDDTFTPGALGYALRAHSSVPHSMAEFLSGPLIFPTHVNNPDIPDWAMVGRIGQPVELPLNIVLAHSAPLVILGIRNLTGATEGVDLYLVINPPSEMPT